METAESIIESVLLPIKKFFGLTPKTQEQKINNEIAKHKRLINLEERSGRLFVVYRNSAEGEKHSFMELNESLTVKEVLDLLNAARSAAVSYNIL